MNREKPADHPECLAESTFSSPPLQLQGGPEEGRRNCRTLGENCSWETKLGYAFVFLSSPCFHLVTDPSAWLSSRARPRGHLMTDSLVLGVLVKWDDPGWKDAAVWLEKLPGLRCPPLAFYVWAETRAKELWKRTLWSYTTDSGPTFDTRDISVAICTM